MLTENQVVVLDTSSSRLVRSSTSSTFPLCTVTVLLLQY